MQCLQCVSNSIGTYTMMFQCACTDTEPELVLVWPRWLCKILFVLFSPVKSTKSPSMALYTLSIHYKVLSATLIKLFGINCLLQKYHKDKKKVFYTAKTDFC